MKQVIFLLAMLLGIQTLEARTIYVNATLGNSSYDGLSSTFLGGSNGPKQTPQQAVNIYQPGDTIRIANGTYSTAPNSIIDIKNKDGIIIIGENADSVIIDATGRQFGISISTATANPTRDVTIRNLTIIHAEGGSSPSHALIWKSRNVLFENIKIIGPGQFGAPGAESVGIKVMESDTVELRDVEVSFCEGNGIEFGGGTGNISMHNINILASSTGLGNGGIFFRTSSAGIYPAGNLEVVSWTGTLELDSCYNGVVFESQNGSITVNFTGNSIIEDNVFLDGASFGSSPPSTATLKQMGFFYLGTIGVLPGAETYFAERQDLIDLTVNPAYVTASIGSNIDRTQFYLAGDMVASLAVNNTSPGDTLVFIGMDFSDVDIQINKPLYLWAENNRATLNSLNVNGAGAEGRLINDFIVEEELILTNGIFYTDDFNRLTMRPGCNVIGGSDIAYVDGPILGQVASASQELVKFPCGLNGAYRPISMAITASSTDTGTYRAELASGPLSSVNFPASVDVVFNSHYWKFSAQNASNFTLGTATLSYDSPDGVSDPSSLRVLFKENSGSNWSDNGGTGTGSPAGEITGNPITESGEFALANATGGGNFTGLEELLEDAGVKVFPNPSSDHIQVLMSENHQFTSVELYDVNGSKIDFKDLSGEQSAEFSVENLPKGLYTLHFKGKAQGSKRILVY